MRTRPGSSPGSLVHRGTRYLDQALLQAHRFDTKTGRTEQVTAPPPWPQAPDRTGERLWLEVTGVHDAQVMATIQSAYGMPALALEDVMATHQRPKFDEAQQGGFLVLRMMQWDDTLDEEQVSVWWNDDVLVSFQERAGDCLQPVRDRLHRDGSRMRTLGTPYLAYAVADAIVDHFFVVLDALGEQVDAVEEAILDDWQQVPIARIQELRRTLLRLRRAAAPLRDASSAMLHADAMPQAVRPYLRDLHDHAVQAVDRVEQQRELVAGLRDLWMNAQSVHMNRVMQTLTVVATVFIPLTFLAGVYGMNFEHIPELGLRWAYPAFWIVALVVGVGSLLLFWRKGWLGSTGP